MPPRRNATSTVLDIVAPIVSAVGNIMDKLLGRSPITEAAATIDVGVGTAATSEGALTELDPVAAAAFGIPTTGQAITRDLAMKVPGIRRGRNLIAGTIGTLPLVCHRTTPAGAVEQFYRPLLAELDPRTTPAYTLTWTVDDLLFRGVSWWRVTRRDATRYPSAVEWLRHDRVVVVPATATSMGRVFVDGVEARDADLIRFDGPDEGLLSNGDVVVRLALALLRAGQRVADDDWSGLILRLVEGAPELKKEQITELLTEWEAARRLRTTGFLNRAVEPHNVGVNAQDRQLTELSQLVASELARLLNLPASRIGAPQGSGMTYSNTESDRRDLVDTTLALYLTPIRQRLSLGDVTPHGQTVTFDLTAYLRGTVTELVNAGVAAINANVASAAEVRTTWLGLPPNPSVTDAPREDPTA